MENVYQLELPPEALKLIYKSVDLHHKNRSGGDAFEQQALLYLKNILYTCVLEETYQQDA